MKYRNLISFAIIFIAAVISIGAQTVSGTLSEEIVSRGSTVKGTIVLTIPEGLHVNSNKPESEYAIPTTIRISGVGLAPAAIEYPAGINRKFQFSESELNVYEGTVTIPFSAAVAKDFRGETLSIRAVVRYQACTDEICYPPKNKEVTITAAVK